MSTEGVRNRLKALRHIAGAGPISRTELAAQLGLASATITEVIADLVRRGLVRESREEQRRPGRPRMQLEVNAGAGFVLAARLAEDEQIEVTIVDLMGQLRLRQLYPFGELSSLASLAEKIVAALEAAIAAAGAQGIARSAICRVQIGLPALIDSDRGEVHWMVGVPDCPYPMAGTVGDRIGLPVSLENDGVDMARAEHWFGRAQGVPDFLLVHVDWALNATRMAGGLPLSGANGYNLSFNHVKSSYDADARPCYCGGHGCLFGYASIDAILSELNGTDPLVQHPTPAKMREFDGWVQRAGAGDAAASAVFHRAGEHLGRAIGNYINAADPGKVLILTGNTALGALLKPSLFVALARIALPGILERTTVEVDETNPDWREVGLSALALEQFYM